VSTGRTLLKGARDFHASDKIKNSQIHKRAMQKSRGYLITLTMNALTQNHAVSNYLPSWDSKPRTLLGFFFHCECFESFLWTFPFSFKYSGNYS
jgi:hypothetical protein